MRKLLFGLFFATLVAAPAHAQVMRSCSGDPWIPCMQAMRPMGVQMRASMPAYFEGDQCGDKGCLIVINKSPGYDVTQFYINDGKREGGQPVWGYNQFNKFALNPMRAVWTPRPRKMKCALSVKVVLRDRKTNEEVEGVQAFDLCSLPDRGFAVFEIALAPQGEVILEDSPQDAKH